MKLGRLFTPETQAIFYNYKEKPVSKPEISCSARRSESQALAC